MYHPLGNLQIHNEEYCPDEIYGALDGPLEDGQVHGVHVCTVHGDEPLPIAREIVARWNAHDDLLAAAIRCIEIRTKMYEAGSDVEVIDRLVTDEIHADDALRAAIAKAKRR